MLFIGVWFDVVWIELGFCVDDEFVYGIEFEFFGCSD